MGDLGTRIHVHVGAEIGTAARRDEITLALGEGHLASLIAVHYYLHSIEATSGQRILSMGLSDAPLEAPATSGAFLKEAGFFGVAVSFQNSQADVANVGTIAPNIVPLHDLVTGSRLFLYIRSDALLTGNVRLEIFYRVRRDIPKNLALAIESRGRS